MQHIDSEEKVRLMRDGTIHAIGMVLSSIAGMLLVPIMVRGLGMDNYGLWVATIAAISMLAPIDVGLRLMVVRELAGEISGTRAYAVRMAFWAHVALGLISGALLSAGGVLVRDHLHLAPASLSLVPVVFAVAGASCVFDQMGAFGLAVWVGLRRFQLFNYYSVALSLARLLVFALVLAEGGGIVAIVVAQAAISIASAAIALILVWQAAPSLAPRVERLRWQALHEPLRFGVLSQAANSISSLQMPISTLLISVISGAAAVTPFAIGQKFPNVLSGITWRTSEVFFPVASRQRESQDAAESQQFMQAISRWMLLLLTPCALGLFLLAPFLLRVWMGSVDPTALLVLRIASATVLIETLIPGAVQLLWGVGRANAVVAMNTAVLIADVLVAVILIPRVGAPGAAWATLVSTVAAVAVCLYLCSRYAATRATGIFSFSLRRMLPALAVSLGLAYLMARIGVARGWPGLVAIVFVSVALYLVAVLVYTGTQEERGFLNSILRWQRSADKV